MDKYRFIIAESNYIIRRGLIACIHELTNAEIVKEPEDAEQLARVVQRHPADFVILNPSFCEAMRPGQQLRQMLQLDKHIKVVAFLPDAQYQMEGLSSADAVLYWTDSKPSLAEKLSPFLDAEKEIDNDLTQREQDIVRSIALGLTNKEIADKLYISPHTVITHRKNITRKLGIKSVSGLTVYAILNNLITVDEVTD